MISYPLVAAVVVFLATLGGGSLLQAQSSANAPSITAESLIAKLRDPQESVRNQAMESLRLLGGSAVGPLKASSENPNVGVRASAASVLGAIGSADALGALLLFALDTNVDVRREVALALRSFANPTQVPTRAAVLVLIGYLDDGDQTVRLLAQRSLGQIGEPAVDDLIMAMRSDQPHTRLGALSPFAMGEIRSTKVIGPIIAVLKRESDDLLLAPQPWTSTIWTVAIEAIGKQGDLAIPALERAIAEGKRHGELTGAFEMALVKARVKQK